MKSLKIDETTREIVIFTHNSKSQSSAKEADPRKGLRKRKRLLEKKVWAVVFKVLKEIFAQLHQNFYKLQTQVFKFSPHHRAGQQPISQVCQCHLTPTRCVRVGCFVKTLGLSTLCSLGGGVFFSRALHR